MNTNARTTFRIALIGGLTSIVNSVELDGELVQMNYVENKHDVTGEYLDYYTDALLEYEPFMKEFTPTEMEDLRKFLRYLRGAVQVKISWTGVRTEAANLLASLTRN